MKKSSVTTTLVAVSAALVLGTPSLAAAGTQSANIEDTSVRVSYADLDLSNDQGIATLYKRLQSASQSACGPLTYSEAGSLKELIQNKSCYQSALTKAVERLNNDSLNKVHAG